MAYLLFVFLAILSTLDSAVSALRWFLAKPAVATRAGLVAMLPASVLTSPLPVLVLAAIVGAGAALASGVEFEYFLVFYTTFFICLDIVFMHGVQRGAAARSPSAGLYAVGLLGLSVAAVGYLGGSAWAWLMIAGTLLVVGGALVTLRLSGEPAAATPGEPGTTREETETAAAPGHAAKPPPARPPGEQRDVSSTGFEGRWFVHRFTTTYVDTNSVGNVYFANYAIWVGKARELLWLRLMPSFDVRTSPYLVLTRDFAHRFVQEAREFQAVSTRIRVARYDRNFCTLEHEIRTEEGKLLGSGRQTLMFVAREDYTLLSVPAEVLLAFGPYAPEEEGGDPAVSTERADEL
jgi:acyl-CoA thioesterase FadM